jgi:hypothetical protein
LGGGDRPPPPLVSFIQPHTCDLPRQQFGDLQKVKGDVVKIKHVDTETPYQHRLHAVQAIHECFCQWLPARSLQWITKPLRESCQTSAVRIPVDTKNETNSWKLSLPIAGKNYPLRAKMNTAWWISQTVATGTPWIRLYSWLSWVKAFLKKICGCGSKYCSYCK